MAGDKVGVKVSEENVADPEAKFLSVGQVLLDIALRVDDDGGRTGLVCDQIGGVGQATQVILFQNHKILYYSPAAPVTPTIRIAGADMYHGHGAESWHK